MGSLTLERVPENLLFRLKEQAALHHRSMEREAHAILANGLLHMARESSVVRRIPSSLSPEEESMRLGPGDDALRPFKGRFPLTSEFIDQAKREGRE